MSTRLGLSAIPRHAYAGFSAKEQAAILGITRLGLSGIPRHAYAAFGAKTAAVDQGLSAAQKSNRITLGLTPRITTL